jgi:hypothetical protein
MNDVMKDYAMKERCFYNLAVVMAKLEPVCGYIETLMSSEPSFATSSQPPFKLERLFSLTKHAQERGGGKNFTSIAFRIILEAILANKADHKQILYLMFTQRGAHYYAVPNYYWRNPRERDVAASLNPLLGLFDTENTQSILEHIMKDKPACIKAFLDYSSVKEMFTPNLIVKNTAFMKMITIELPINNWLVHFSRLVTVWKALVLTRDEEFCTFLFKVGEQLVTKTCTERVVARAKDHFQIFMTGLKSCLTQCEPGTSKWQALKVWGIKVLKNKKAVQSCLQHI